MYIKFIKKHPSGFQKDAGLNTSDVFGSQMVSQGFAKEVNKADFAKLKSNAVLVAELIAKAKELECEDCGDDKECEDCKEANKDSSK